MRNTCIIGLVKEKNFINFSYRLLFIWTFFLNVNVVLIFMIIEGLYSGLGWLTLGRSLGLGARFGVYEIITAFYTGMISSVA